ncbi:MAG: CarD family transcriptional regulator [Eubacteriales bacterium]|nr:CarD family transcriptional regulator [Eubacteriales bacterium]
MFQKGDLVTYGCKGICEIKEITTLQMDGIPRDRLYYEMQSLLAGSKIFTPVEPGQSKNVMRLVLTEDEAHRLLSRMPECVTFWVREDRAREEVYREIINNCDAGGMLTMIRSLYARRRERVMQGRKLAALDSRYLKIAEDNLYAELALVLHVTREEIRDYVTRQVLALEGAIQPV